MNRFRMFCAAIAASSVCSIAGAQSANPGGTDTQTSPPSPPDISLPEVWMGDNNLEVLAQFPNDWDCTAQQIQVLKLYINEIDRMSVADLTALVQLLEQRNIKIAIELAGLNDAFAHKGTLSADRSFLATILTVRKLTDPVTRGGAGGTVSYLEMDGPIRRMLWPNNTVPSAASVHTIDSATDELIDVMEMWRREIQGVKITLLTNFPNWGWKGAPAYRNLGLTPGSLGYGDYIQVLQMAASKAAAAGVPLYAITADNPYDYAIGYQSSNQPALIAGINWMRRVLDLENESRLNGLEFHLIYNSQRGGFSSDQWYFLDTMSYIDDYAAIGGQPETAVIQTWYPKPRAVLPEETPWTMTNVVLEAVKKLRPLVACP